ncbi:MAG: cell division FtsZ family protein [Chitinispirillales bacterium]|nr:cell division FtsZ family protein [Chitinispirillales bacterium]
MKMDFSRMDIEPTLNDEKTKNAAPIAAKNNASQDEWVDELGDMDFVPPTVNTIVFSVGNAGGNILKYMGTSNICKNVKYVIADTDYAALKTKEMPNCKRILLGEKTCKGFGAGMHPEIANQAALETEEKIRSVFKDVKLVLLIAGEGGGTGTGASPVIARIAKEEGAIVIAMVTKPFGFEGKKVMTRAINGINELKKEVDAIEVIDNNKVNAVAEENTPAIYKFRKIDEFHGNMIAGFINVIKDTSTINLDFNDVKMMLDECKGNMFIGVGESMYKIPEKNSEWDYGEKAMMEAVERAISCPLIDGVNLSNAKGIMALYRVGEDISLEVLEKAQNRVNTATDEENANIIYGINFDKEMNGKIEVLLIIAGLEEYNAERHGDEKIVEHITCSGYGTAIGMFPTFDNVKSTVDIENDDKGFNSEPQTQTIIAGQPQQTEETKLQGPGGRTTTILGLGNTKNCTKNHIPSIHGFDEIPQFLRKQCQ